MMLVRWGASYIESRGGGVVEVKRNLGVGGEMPPEGLRYVSYECCMSLKFQARVNVSSPLG